jgi:hypothetical protein
MGLHLGDHYLGSPLRHSTADFFIPYMSAEEIVCQEEYNARRDLHRQWIMEWADLYCRKSMHHLETYRSQFVRRTESAHVHQRRVQSRGFFYSSQQKHPETGAQAVASAAHRKAA